MFFLLACTLAEVDTASTASEGGEDTSGDVGGAPEISKLEVLWQEFGDEGVVMYADATVADPDGDLVGGTARFDVAAEGESPMGLAEAIEDCADVSGACWIDPHLIIAIPDVITSYNYTVELWVIDAEGNTSEGVSGALAGG